MEAKRLLCFFNEHRQICPFVYGRSSLNEHRFGCALDEFLCAADSQREVVIDRSLKTIKMLLNNSRVRQPSKRGLFQTWAPGLHLHSLELLKDLTEKFMDKISSCLPSSGPGRTPPHPIRTKAGKISKWDLQINAYTTADRPKGTKDERDLRLTERVGPVGSETAELAIGKREKCHGPCDVAKVPGPAL